MRIKFLRFLGVLGALYSLFFAQASLAQEKRVGLANYDIVSGENVDYLKKAVREALSASLKEKGAVTLVEINQSEEEIKKKGPAKVIKSEKVDAIITGSIVKLGAPVQINTRIYGPSGLEEPSLVSVTVDSLDRLLPSLKTHSQSILDQLNRMENAGPALAEPKVEPKKEEKKK